jgi:hypothetical protein
MFLVSENRRASRVTPDFRFIASFGSPVWLLQVHQPDHLAKVKSPAGGQMDAATSGSERIMKRLETSGWAAFRPPLARRVW